MVDYFSILGLTSSASDAEIKEAYRRLAKQYHPDSNPSAAADLEAAKKMQRLNQAKQVLFDPIAREEHRVLLGLQKTVTKEQLLAFRERYSPVDEFNIGFNRSANEKSFRKLYAIVGGMLVFVVGILAFMYLKPKVSSADPIREIVERHLRKDADPFPSTPVKDTVQIPDDSLPKLLRKGDILFGLGEYRMAAKYYEKYLSKDSANEDVIKNLSLAYFKRGRYAESLELLSKEMHGDSNLVVAYYNIGELFLKEEKPFDARNAFQATLRVAEHMRLEGRTNEYFDRAKWQLDRLN